MIGLELAGALQRSDTLPNELDMTKVARLRLRGRGLRRASSLREAAQDAGKAELAAALGRSIRSSKLRMTAKTSLEPLRPVAQRAASVLHARLPGRGA